MKNIPRAFLNDLINDSSSIEDLVNAHQEQVMRERLKRMQSREHRQLLHGVPKHAPMIANTIAPGVDVERYLGVQLLPGGLRVVNYAMGR